MIYLNNAGTTWPKPPEVYEACQNALQSGPEEWGQIYDEALAEVVDFFGIPAPDRFLFTSGCTSALALGITDLPWKSGDRVITSRLEHHALSRQLLKLAEEREVNIDIAPYTRDNPLDLEYVERSLKKGGVRLIAVSQAANVTGDILPIRELAGLAHNRGALLLVDGAQSAGILPLHLGELEVDLFTFAGHKGPLAPLGIGGLYIAPGVEMNVPAATCELSSGSGADSESSGGTKPKCVTSPSFCDVGSFNVPAGAALTAGLRFIQNQGLENLRRKGIELCKLLSRGLNEIENLRVFGGSNSDLRTHAISLRRDDESLARTNTRLKAAGIIASAGFQCSPWAHEALNTADQGTIRLSVGPFNTEEDLKTVLGVLSS